MDKGKAVMGTGRRWAVDFSDQSTVPSSRDILDPPGFSRASPEQDDSATSRQKKDAEANWYNRFLSPGGKEIMLKSVALSLPIYTMQCFNLPKQTCTQLNSSMANFWWQNNENKKAIHWLSWDKLCLPKKYGGLGFRNLRIFNQALLAKQAWRILTNPTSLYSQIIKSRYFPNDTFLTAQRGSKPSYGWLSILHGRELLKSGLVKCIGNGQQTNVWTEKWIGDVQNRRIPLIKNSIINIDQKVSNLLDPQSNQWNVRQLNELFYPADIDSIRKIKPIINKEDFWIWKYNRKGICTVKTGYWQAWNQDQSNTIISAHQQPSINNIKEQIWNIQAPTKIKHFIWKAISNTLPVNNKLKEKRIPVQDMCVRCGMEEETANHILFQCTWTRQLWALSNYPSLEKGFDLNSIYSNIHYLVSNLLNPTIPIELRHRFPWLLWRVWKSRNFLNFEGKNYSLQETLQKIISNQNTWESSQLDLAEQQLHHQHRLHDESKLLNSWTPPDVGSLKCNIGISWSKRKQLAGGAWIIRDHKGKTLIHSRRAFTNIDNKEEAAYQITKWSIESICSHRFHQMEFELSNHLMAAILINPSQWPSYTYYSDNLSRLIAQSDSFSFQEVRRHANRAAQAISDSVTIDRRLQSYVALSHPRWLSETINSDIDHLHSH